MKKQEALAVLHKIIVVIMESSIISCVSLDHNSSQISKDPNNGGYLIRIKCDLNSYTKHCLKSILEEYKLALKEENGYVLILKPE